MGKFYYQSHMGGIYLSDEEIPTERLYCDECYDSDWLIGEYETFEDFLRDRCEDIIVMRDEETIDQYGGYLLHKGDLLTGGFQGDLWDAYNIVMEAREALGHPAIHRWEDIDDD